MAIKCGLMAHLIIDMQARKKRDVGSAEGAVDPHQNGSDQNDIDEPVQAALD